MMGVGKTTVGKRLAKKLKFKFIDIDKIIEKNGVRIIGYSNYASRTAYSASGLLAKNIINFLPLLIDKNEKSIKVDYDDEIVKGVII